VEVEDDGSVKVLDYRAIDDVGVVVNPMLAQGQVMGGIIQGLKLLNRDEIMAVAGHELGHLKHRDSRIANGCRSNSSF